MTKLEEFTFRMTKCTENIVEAKKRFEECFQIALKDRNVSTAYLEKLQWMVRWLDVASKLGSAVSDDEACDDAHDEFDVLKEEFAERTQLQ